jgi:hydroxyethylthiazole kinase-like uncharacterized protein yjeF
VVTPHDREYARLAGEVVGEDRVDAARRLAQQLGVVVLLKGDRTVVASPEGPAWVNPTGTPALATAGSGDVLAGLVASLLAAGVPAERAAVAGAYVHGLAGRLASAGPAPAEDGRSAMAGWPVTAPNVADALPAVIGSLLNAY